MSGDMNFIRILMLDASGNELPDGELVNILSFSETRNLSKIGSASFTIPIGVRQSKYIQTGTQFLVFDSDGFVGRYRFRSNTISEGVMTVELSDMLEELAIKETVGFRRSYSQQPITTVVGDLLDIVGWSSVVDSDDTITITFDGESVFRAIDQIRDITPLEFRLGIDQDTYVPVLEMSEFGDDSGVILEHLAGQVQYAAQLNNVIPIIDFQIQETGVDQIVNKVVALGQGQGVAQLTLQGAVGDYTVQSGLNGDGTEYFYITDDDSITQYGQHTRVLTTNIRPISNGIAATQIAKNTLLAAAVNYLKKHNKPHFQYAITVAGLQSNRLKVGDKVHVRYLEHYNGRPVINVNEHLYIVAMTTQRTATGENQTTLTVANQLQLRTSDADAIVDVFRNVGSLNLNLPANTALSETGPIVKRLLGDANPANQVRASVTVRIREEIRALLKSTLRIETEPLKASATGAGHVHKVLDFSGAWLGGHPVSEDYEYFGRVDNTASTFQNFVLPVVSLTRGDLYTWEQDGEDNLSYGVFEQTGVYPGGIGIIYENTGQDVTALLGGPFGNSTSATEIELDITAILETGPNGYQDNHEFTFYATEGQGDIIVTVDNMIVLQAVVVN